MKKKCADKWLIAIKSGKYFPSKGKLKHENCYSALGILCDISGMDEWILKNEENKYYSYCGNINRLPPEIIAWSGIASSYGAFSIKDSIMKMQERCCTFEEIADIIEKYWETL